MTESELLAACRAGDQAAFATLVHRNRHVAWTVCREITGSNEDAEDALQEALTSAWQNIAKFRGDSRFSTWLYRISSNAATTVARRRTDTGRLSFDDMTEFDEPVHPGTLTDDRVASVDSVRRAIADLPDEFKIPIILREFADLSYSEIAEHQNVPIDTIRTRIHRGRRQLVRTLREAS